VSYVGKVEYGAQQSSRYLVLYTVGRTGQDATMCRSSCIARLYVRSRRAKTLGHTIRT
jgi:hypothetical protein